jgi:magnesium-transporting ATPase (P-type)
MRCFAVYPGDKVETAISIAYSCHLFSGDMRMVELREAYLPADLDDAAVREVGPRPKSAGQPT